MKKPDNLWEQMENMHKEKEAKNREEMFDTKMCVMEMKNAFDWLIRTWPEQGKNWAELDTAVKSFHTEI